MAHAGALFDPSTVASIEAEELVATEVDRSALPTRAREEVEKTHAANLNHWEKKVRKQAEDDYFKFSRSTR